MSLVPFALWSAFPTAHYYGTSATSCRQQATVALPVLLAQGVGAWMTLPTFAVIR